MLFVPTNEQHTQPLHIRLFRIPKPFKINPIRLIHHLRQRRCPPWPGRGYSSRVCYGFGPVRVWQTLWPMCLQPPFTPQPRPFVIRRVQCFKPNHTVDYTPCRIRIAYKHVLWQQKHIRSTMETESSLWVDMGVALVTGVLAKLFEGVWMGL